jgi:adenosylcobyric acid synthase
MNHAHGNRPAACLAVLGTGSDVGKSIVTTALCRIFADRGYQVAPFKAQNMSNNSGVTPEGLEMGRAQIAQAEAARRVPHVDMNPVLLKPTSDVGAQVVLNGTVWRDATAQGYHQQQRKAYLFNACTTALDRLRDTADVVIMEGAGSCAEVNLMADDIVNLRMAAYAQAPVILVADIDRGGVFAQIVGTLACLPSHQKAQIHGFIINRFRGDLALFQEGVRWIEAQTAKPVLGVLPWFDHFHIDAEDSVVIEQVGAFKGTDGEPAIAVIRLPHISNFTDFAPLEQIQGLHLAYVDKVQSLDMFRAVILPGSKSTRHDLDWLHAVGWVERLHRYAAQGGHILGICGGYQIMGRRVFDPDGVEGPSGNTPGLNLLGLETELKSPKTTTRTVFEWDGIQGQGYEIHMGQTRRFEGRPLVSIQSRNQTTCADDDGCISEDGRAVGTYIHGFFDTPAIVRHWLTHIGLGHLKTNQLHGPAARDRAYDLLARHVEAHVDTDAIVNLLEVRPSV